MTNKRFVWAGAIVILLLAAGAAVYFFSGAGSNSTSSLLSGASAQSSLQADQIGPDEHVMGSATAPLTIIEYFSQGCSVCAGFDRDVFPLLKAKYIDTGKVRYVMRLFPLFPVDGPAYKLDTCVPPEHFFQAADLLFRNQPQWDSGEYPVQDPHAGLIRMARILGLTPEQADACMKSTAMDAAINQRAQDAVTRYQPEGTPTFVIDFKKVDVPDKSWAAIQPIIDAALAAKGVK